uniref:Uncharacterized protein n=1 Tax=Lepeophtheirus salmonis TaxID=72036 RepID=A0A0K2V6U7_LEPSM
MKSFSLVVIELQFGFKSNKTNPFIRQCYYYKVRQQENALFFLGDSF